MTKKKIPAEELEQIEHQGGFAFMSGKMESENPYTWIDDPDRYSAWDCGYDNASWNADDGDDLDFGQDGYPEYDEEEEDR